VRQILIALATLALVALVEAVLHVYRWSEERRRDELRRRLNALGEERTEENTLVRAARYAATPGLDAFVRSLPLSARIERLLEQTDSRLTVAQVLGYSAMAGAAGLFLTLMLHAGVALNALATLLGAAAPTLLLRAARERRSRRLSEQLPEALDMMSRSLRAGHALTSAFELVATEMPEPVAVEFGRAFEAQRLGIPVDEAILQMTGRAPSNRDLKIFSVSVVIQKETGGNLAEILGQLAETIRARFRFHGKVRALTAEGRASAYLVGAMPIFIAAILRVINPEYLVPLVTTPLGRVILTGACASWLVGVTWLHRMTQLDL
jgi:tight adherence protein B